MDSIYFVISNINPLSIFSANPVFVNAGDGIGFASEMGDSHGIHIEAYKILGNSTYSINPTQFLAPVLKPQAEVIWECNDITTMVNDVVIDTRTIGSSSPVLENIGDPLITIDIDDEEFPHPYDLIIDDQVGISSSGDMDFFQGSTFLTVGVIPVTFSEHKYFNY